MNTPKVHPRTQEMKVISDIIDSKPTICDYVLQDLIRDKNAAAYKCANGMTAEQVLRAAIVYRLHDCTYRSLAFHLDDSKLLKWFCRIGIADKGFKKSVLQQNIKALSSSTWETIHREILGYAAEQDIEKGRSTRIDCTVVESNIHAPSDSTLLWDSVRVLARMLKKARDLIPRSGIRFQDHTRRAKRHMLNIQYAKTKKQRKYAGQHGVAHIGVRAGCDQLRWRVERNRRTPCS